jgi:hypothetical protein
LAVELRLPVRTGHRIRVGDPDGHPSENSGSEGCHLLTPAGLRLCL